MKVLHIDTSLRENKSVSRELTQFFLDQLAAKTKISVDRLDLAKSVPGHMTQQFLDALFTPETNRNPEQLRALSKSEKLIARLFASDLLLIGIPMYNFSIPSHFKTFIDNVVVSGKTFVSDENGDRGLVTGKKAVVITTKGGLYNSEETSSMDFVSPYVKTVLAFIGILDITLIDVQPTLYYGPEEEVSAIEAARNRVIETVENLKTKQALL